MYIYVYINIYVYIYLNSLKGMNSDDQEVRAVLSAFIIKLRNVKGDLKAVEVARILRGMQGILSLMCIIHEIFG
jgi:hypothetical protein